MRTKTCTVGNLTADEKLQLPGSFVELSGGITHYELLGQDKAPTAVLIHGNMAPYVTWDNTVDDLLAAGYRVLRYDIFGHGFSARPKLRKYTCSLYDTQLVELLDSLGIAEPVFLVGTSQGGRTCAYFAANHPERVRKVALLSPFYDDYIGAGKVSLLKLPVLGEVLIRLFANKRLQDLSEALFSPDKRATLTPKIKAQLQFEGKHRAILANLRGDALHNASPDFALVSQHGIPMLLTWGDKDQTVPRQSMERLRASVPAIVYHEILDAGHLAHYEFPELITPKIIDFFECESSD